MKKWMLWLVLVAVAAFMAGCACKVSPVGPRAIVIDQPAAVVEKPVVVEKTVERIIEKPVEKVVTVEKIVEKPVEKIVYVDKPVTVETKAYPGIRDVFFPYDSAELTPLTRNILKKNAEIIKASSGVKFLLEATCSPEGSIEYNLKLAERRVKAVYDYLVGLGVGKDLLMLKSLGEIEVEQVSYPFARKVHFETLVK
ncbi:MAG TPA: OmpA family protein [bacterium]|uniref:Outer membrane protein P6 n=1 Tax=candidate division TA06 bacterium ADurb.Bin417 TaxID=1852828 RepID=A0A1V5MHQ3_UNCT6|nr:MAG: Outer membrane protein P6 precursor [candidate division TA06 bacterium ADurb.Bin417]HNS48203.1 OmpA family protein [bacterium]